MRAVDKDGRLASPARITIIAFGGQEIYSWLKLLHGDVEMSVWHIVRGVWFFLSLVFLFLTAQRIAAPSAVSACRKQ